MGFDFKKLFNIVAGLIGIMSAIILAFSIWFILT
jgi:hypothetical protein